MNLYKAGNLHSMIILAATPMCDVQRCIVGLRVLPAPLRDICKMQDANFSVNTQEVFGMTCDICHNLPSLQVILANVFTCQVFARISEIYFHIQATTTMMRRSHRERTCVALVALLT